MMIGGIESLGIKLGIIKYKSIDILKMIDTV